MNVNPEFQRNLWLELTPYRLIGMPAVLGAVFFLAYVSSDYRMGEGVGTTSVTLYILISMIWGTKLASEAIMNEIRDHTWDGQRMSAITPWQLTWGKLFGSTIFSWYGALICVGFYAASVTGKEPVFILKTCLALLLSAVLAHAVSLLASLTAIRKERKFNKSQTAAMLVLGIIVAGPFMNMALIKGTAVPWFGVKFPEMDFLLMSALAFASWAVIGVYQMMRLELQMKNGPWVWFGFTLFLMLYGAGLFYGSPQVGERSMAVASPSFLAAYCIAVGAVYFMAFAERKDFLTMRQVAHLASSGNWRRFLERAPRWLLTLPLAFAAAGGFLISAGVNGKEAGQAVAFMVASMFFVLRDLGIMLFCNLARRPRRADMLFVLYLTMLYGIFPATLSAMDLDRATLVFWPRVDLDPVWGCAAALLEAAVMAYLVSMRWKKRSAE